MSDLRWVQQRLCTDVDDYELIVEKQKQNWECEEVSDSWKWSVVYHGSVVASGSVNDMEEAKLKAEANIPSHDRADKKEA